MEILTVLVEKLWLRYISIPITILIDALIVVFQIPQDGTPLGYKFYLITGISTTIALIYIIITVKKNSLPYADNDKIGVLYIIKSENLKTYEHVKHCLVSKFEELSQNYEKPKTQIICVLESDVSKYPFSDKENFKKLLLRTNCIFAVYTRYTVDDADAAENFEMCINYALIHPKLKEEAHKALKLEMSIFAANIRKQNFLKNNSIQTFNVTAQKLSYICEYFLGISFMLTNRISLAKDIFIELEKSMVNNKLEDHFERSFVMVIRTRIFWICFAIINSEYASYRQTRDFKYLNNYRCLLEEANKYIQNTYEYNLDSGMLSILIDKNIANAAMFIEKCKLIKGRNEWRYSEAFLAAYDNEINPLKVYRKYQGALKHDINIIIIIDFIEDILDQEPEHGGLHLALGLIYHDIKDFILMSYHLKKYKEWLKEKGHSSGVIEIIDQYLNA